MPTNSLKSSGLQSFTDSWPRLRQLMDGPAQSCGTHCTRLSLSRQSNRKQKTTIRYGRNGEVIFTLSVVKGWCWNPSTCGACEFGRSRRTFERPCQRHSNGSLFRLFVLWRFSCIFLGSLLEGCDLPGSVWPSQGNGAGGQSVLNPVMPCGKPLLIQAPRARASAVHFASSHSSPFPTQVHSPEFGWWTAASERGSIFLKLVIFTARSSPQDESLTTALCLFRQIFWQCSAQVLQKIEDMVSEAQASSSVKN